MANNLRYPSFLGLLLVGGVDLSSDPLMAQLTDGYTPSVAHNFFDDVPSGDRVDAAQSVTVDSTADGKVLVTVPDFPAVTTGYTVNGVVFYIDTGVESTSPLCWFIGKKKDGTLLAIPTNGTDDISLEWLDPVFSIGGS